MGWGGGSAVRRTAWKAGLEAMASTKSLWEIRPSPLVRESTCSAMARRLGSSSDICLRVHEGVRKESFGDRGCMGVTFDGV